MLPVNIHKLGTVSDKELTRVVCVSQYKGKWVYSKHKERQTWEIPGGHIEEGETWLEAAKRELYEETGATDVEIEPICQYSISSYGLLCYANIKKIDEMPEYEMEKIGFFDVEPDNLTYKDTYHLFFKTVKNNLENKNNINKELEICVKVLTDFNSIMKIMKDKGFKVQEDFQLNDIYMIENNKEISLENADDLLSNYILVRETVGKRIMLEGKSKKLNDKNEIIEQQSIKCQISDKLAGYEFMTNLGYKKFLEINDHNVLLTNGKNEIYIQDVENLGVYIEMEQKNLLLDNNNGNTLEDMINNLKEYKLPIDESNFFSKKAYDMLLKNI